MYVPYRRYIIISVGLKEFSAKLCVRKECEGIKYVYVFSFSLFSVFGWLEDRLVLFGCS